jgi:hypothetical protein
MRSVRTWLGLLLVALAGGCDSVTPIYRASTGGFAGSDISPKGTWTATGSLSNPQAALDEDLATAARSDLRVAEPELTLDLKRLCLFQTVIVEHGAEPNGHGRTVSVSTSEDGRLFLQRHVGPGTRRVTILCLPVPVLARYVRLKAAGSGSMPWNVAEVYLQ